MIMKKFLVSSLAMVLCWAASTFAAPINYTITYQGRLLDANLVADGFYDFQFSLHDANIGGSQIGSDINTPNLDVFDGYFTAELTLDDVNAFNGDTRWLEISVRPGDMNDPNTYTVLEPRQKVTSAPQALYVHTPLDLQNASDDPLVGAFNTGTGFGLAAAGTNRAAVFGLHVPTGNYGLIGDANGGVSGYAGPSGNAGYFVGDVIFNGQVVVPDGNSITFSKSGSIDFFQDAEITVGRNITTTISSDSIMNINSDLQTTIGTGETRTVGTNRITGIGGSDMYTIGSDWKLDVLNNWDVNVNEDVNIITGQDAYHTIGHNYYLNILNNGYTDVGATCMTDVGDDLNFNVGSNATFKIGDQFKIDAGTPQFIINHSGDVELTSKNLDLINTSDVMMSSNRFLLDVNGVGIGTPTPAGLLDVNGPIYQRGKVLHADYVFENDYELESIEQHAEYMWTNKHLPAIPKAQTDETGQEIIEVGAHRKGIVEELEKAHIYIEQLNQENKRLNEKLNQQNKIMKEKIEQLEVKLKALENKM